MKNKKANLGGYVQFIATLFVTLIVFLVLRKPIINPMIDNAVNSVTDPWTKVILKFIPLVFIFFLTLIVISLLRRGGN